MLDTTLSRDGTSATSLKPRTIGFIIANLLFLVQGMVGYGGVLLGLLPQTPTDDFAFFLIVVAYHGPFFAFLDAKGERRSKDEKFQLFVNWWIIVAASAAIFLNSGTTVEAQQVFAAPSRSRARRAARAVSGSATAPAALSTARHTLSTRR